MFAETAVALVDGRSEASSLSMDESLKPKELCYSLCGALGVNWIVVR